VPVQGGAGAVLAHGRAGVGVAGSDLDVAQVDACPANWLVARSLVAESHPWLSQVIT